LNESSSDEEELNINIPASQSGVAAQKQQNINGSTVQNDNFTDRDEARIKLILEFLKRSQFFFLQVLIFLGFLCTKNTTHNHAGSKQILVNTNCIISAFNCY